MTAQVNEFWDSEQTSPGDWLSIDFHVHTPNSYDFGGPKELSSGSEKARYEWWLRCAGKANIDIIVVTDHNDIRGYDKLINMSHELRHAHEFLQSNSANLPENLAELHEIFTRVILLRGVEIDTNLGVHYLVIFDPATPTELIDLFLTNAGFPIERRGNERTALGFKWSPQDVCREANQIGAIVIAAHVDSTNGIYETTKDSGGRVRIVAFTDPGLFAMEFLKPVSRDQIENILTLPDYKRDTPLAFVQSSDFHGRQGEKIGTRRTWVRMDGIRREPKAVFDALSKALRAPDEFISAPERPQLRNILRQMDKANTPTVPSLDGEDQTTFLKLACAFSNGNGGRIIIGRTLRKNWVGYPAASSKEVSEKIANTLRERLQPAPERFETRVYSYFDDRYIATVMINSSDNVSTIDNKSAFRLDLTGKLRECTIRDIADLAEEKLIRKFSKLSITNRVRGISQQLSGVTDSIDILPIVRKLDGISTPFEKLLNKPKLGSIATSETLRKFDVQHLHGYADGNVAVAIENAPRGKTHYLRISPQYLLLDDEEVSTYQKGYISGDKVIIAAGGAVYFDNKNVVVLGQRISPLIFQDSGAGISMRWIAAYLKSTLALWVAQRTLGSVDFRDPEILKKMPILNMSEPFGSQVIELTDKLLTVEQAFLTSATQLTSVIKVKREEKLKDGFRIHVDKSYSQELERLSTITDEHNRLADELMRQIDLVFYDAAGLGSQDAQVISTSVLALNFTDFCDTSTK